ncbi:MAG: hypothetical protein GY749_22740 [Desulfobacteraceae bacterium]|nr:hypothetical protein [Desulfobacteraceae bacterium]
MTSSIAAEDICNMALDMLIEAPITSLNDNDPNARRFKRNFDQWRDMFLSSHPWNFATKRVSIPADSTGPAHGWDYRYLLPGECLRFLPLRMSGEFEGNIIPHEIEGQYILTDESPPLKARYIWRNEAYGSWSPEAINAFAGLLAAKVAMAITGKNSVLQTAETNADNLLGAAKRLDGMQSHTERPSYQDVISVRYV